MSEIVSNLKKMTAIILEHNWFFTFFFAPVFSLRKDFELGIPLIPYCIPVKFKIDTTVKTHSHKKGEHVVTLQGNFCDQRSEKDILKPAFKL